MTGDKYGREWVSSAWRKCGLAYTPATLTASETYLEALPLWTRGAVRIPDHPDAAARAAPAGAHADAHGQGSGRRIRAACMTITPMFVSVRSTVSRVRGSIGTRTHGMGVWP